MKNLTCSIKLVVLAVCSLVYVRNMNSAAEIHIYPERINSCATGDSSCFPRPIWRQVYLTLQRSEQEILSESQINRRYRLKGAVVMLLQLCWLTWSRVANFQLSVGVR